MNDQSTIGRGISGLGKFSDRQVTATGQARASVGFNGLQTLWFNTGTLCNIECSNCYILSSPRNDALVYLDLIDVESYLDEIARLKWGTPEIGFTGGEPFMNPAMTDILEATLKRGFPIMMLTNAMAPMMRSRVRDRVRHLEQQYPGRMTFRVSVDHYTKDRHDAERGRGAFEKTLTGMRWLRDNGVRMDVAARTKWGECEAEARRGFGALFEAEGFDIPAEDPSRCVLFPEMDESADVPEITTDCWRILGKQPVDVMCASSRMIVKRRGSTRAVVLSCTLLAYDHQFEMGETLEEAAKPVWLNHPHCAKFCVLGGASCSG